VKQKDHHIAHLKQTLHMSTTDNYHLQHQQTMHTCLNAMQRYQFPAQMFFYVKCGTITTLQDIWPHCIAAMEAKPSKMFSTEDDS